MSLVRSVFGHPVTHVVALVGAGGLVRRLFAGRPIGTTVVLSLLVAAWLFGALVVRVSADDRSVLRTLVAYATLVTGATIILGLYVVFTVSVLGVGPGTGPFAVVTLFLPTAFWLLGFVYAEGSGRESAGGGAGFGDRVHDWVAHVARDRASDATTGRWQLAVTYGVLAGGIGIVVGSEALVLAAVVPTAFLAFASLSASIAPDPRSLTVERTVTDESPLPGDDVAIELRVTNGGDRMAPDVRCVDGVPESLSVVDGSPRLSATLRPGETATARYVVRASRGVHEWDPATVVCSDLADAMEHREAVDVASRIAVKGGVETAPVPVHADGPAGQVPTDEPGSGVEFHSVRDYKPGDPLNRVDWSHFAETGSLATVSFRKHRASTAVLVVDGGRDDDVTPGDLWARSAYAAAAISVPLLERGDLVAAYRYPEGSWLEPGRGAVHRRRVTTAIERGSTPGTADVAPDRLDAVMPGNAHVVLCSPCIDAAPVDFCRRLITNGFPVTVISPRSARADGLAETLADLRRTVRLTRLREHGTTVVDWSRDVPLDVALREQL